MNRDEMQSTPHPLSSGAELHVYNDAQNTILQFRQPAASEIDPLASSVQIATRLTAPECIALASTLLLYAAAKVEEKQAEPEQQAAPLGAFSGKWG